MYMYNMLYSYNISLYLSIYLSVRRSIHPSIDLSLYMAVCQNLVPLVNIKIAGKWMFITLKMVLIGIDP